MGRHSEFACRRLDARRGPLALLLAMIVAGAGAAGCAKKAVVTAPEPPPPLEVPVAPPRVLAPVAAPEAPRPERVEEPEAPPAQRSRAGSKPGETRPEAGKTEPAGEVGPPAPVVDTSRSAEPATPGLRTTQAANEGETERRVKEGLARARRDLERVNRATLSTDARTQFDTARRFIDQAGDALAARNFMFAAYLADKAQALARGLAAR